MQNNERYNYVKKYIGTKDLLNSFIKKYILTHKEKEQLIWSFEELQKERANQLFIDDAYKIIYKKLNNNIDVQPELKDELFNKKNSDRKKPTNYTLLKFMGIVFLVLVVINFKAYDDYVNIGGYETSVDVQKLELKDGLYHSAYTNKPFRGEAYETQNQECQFMFEDGIAKCKIKNCDSKYKDFEICNYSSIDTSSPRTSINNLNYKNSTYYNSKTHRPFTGIGYKVYSKKCTTLFDDGKPICTEKSCGDNDSKVCTDSLIYMVQKHKKNAKKRLKSIDWLNKIVILIFAILFILNIRKKYKKIQVYELPNHFLKLSSEQRKLALDYAWDVSTKISDDIPLATTVKSFFASNIFKILLASMAIIILFVFLKFHSIIFASSMIVFVFLLYKFNIVNMEYKYALEKEKSLNDMRNKLVDLAISFVNDNIRNWMEESENKHIKAYTVKAADMVPDKTYVLYSFDTNMLSNVLMPPSSVYLTYIFLEKYITIISKIKIDIKKISYSFLKKDEPTYYVSNKEEWDSEEFHYTDIVEIGYHSINPDEKKVDSIKNKNNQDIQRGVVFISLVNSTIKEYPTTKKDVENLFIEVRTRVRSSKS